MLARTIAFVEALRRAGIPVAVSETLDAVNAVAAVPLATKDTVRAALAATLVKSGEARATFDLLFDLYFATGEKATEPVPGDPETLIAELGTALMQGLTGGPGGLGELAERAVEAYGRVEDSPSDSVYFEYPVLRALDPDGLLALLEASLEGLDPLERRIQRDRLRAAIAELKEEVRRQVRRRVAARKGPQAVARYAVRPQLEDLDLSTATMEELNRLRRAVHPLARRLATRLAIKHRRGRRGRLDLKRTIRHSLSTGGVPFDTYMRKRAPHRPELFVLCDVSDSVARFARFSLMLVHALQSQFSRVRSFAFIDTIDEVTRLFDHEDFLVAVDRLATEADVILFERNSNYGESLERFLELHGKDVTSRTTVLILGDARNNNRVPRANALKEIRGRAHRVYWLNPEAESYWDTGDSIASVYRPHVDEMVEVRTVRQLEEFVAAVL